MSTAPDIFRFRTLPVISAPESIDADKGVIRGVSAMQAVEALGHGMTIDAATLDQVAKLGNAATGKGIKVRFGHPGACDNALGTLVGHATNFRVVGDKVLNDITLSESASVSPKGNLRAYLLKLAQENPRDFGMSVVIKAKRAWKLAAGGEAISDKRPENAVGDLPFARVQELKAVDFVDEPAANRDGLFADADLVAAFSGTSADAEDAFATLDDLRARMGLSVVDVGRFAERYLRARLHATPTNPETDMKLPSARLAALKSEYPDQSALIIDLAVADKDEGEIRSELSKANVSALSAKVADLAKQLADKDAAHKAAIDKKDKELTDLHSKHDAIAKLGKEAKDPGSDASAATGDAVEQAWSQMSQEQRSPFFGDLAVYREHLHQRAAAKTTIKEA